MNRKDYEQRLDELEREIAALRQEAVEDESELPPHPRPYPECDQNQYYFYVNTMGDIEKTKWIADLFDLGAHEIGNVFVTKDAADFAAERLKVLAQMREWAGKWNDEFTLRYDENSGIETYIHVFPFKSYGEVRFATKEDAEGCIKAVGEDRLIKYYFGVPDNVPQ